MTPARDDEVHRDKRELEKDIEQHQVERRERPQASGLEHQEEGDVGRGAIGNPSREHKRNEEQHGGEQKQWQAYAIHSYSVGAAE